MLRLGRRPCAISSVATLSPLLLATSVRSAQRDVDLIILDCRRLKLARWQQRALQRRNRRAFGDEFEKTHDGVQHIAAAVLPKIVIVSPSPGPALGTSSVDALWARFYRRTLALHGKFPGVPPRAQVATQFRDNACFTKGKCCINCERPVNKGLAMLQMLVAQSGHEKDPHAASALPFYAANANWPFPPRP